MADISREEVKKIMNSCLGCLMGKYDCVGKPCSMCEHNVSDEEIENAIGKAISDMEKLEKIEQNLENIDIAIRCAMCTNSMDNDRCCDGGCRINEAIYKKVLDVINEEIEQIVK